MNGSQRMAMTAPAAPTPRAISSLFPSSLLPYTLRSVEHSRSAASGANPILFTQLVPAPIARCNDGMDSSLDFIGIEVPKSYTVSLNQ